MKIALLPKELQALAKKIGKVPPIEIPTNPAHQYFERSINWEKNAELPSPESTTLLPIHKLFCGHVLDTSAPIHDLMVRGLALMTFTQGRDVSGEAKNFLDLVEEAGRLEEMRQYVNETVDKNLSVMQGILGPAFSNVALRLQLNEVTMVHQETRKRSRL